MSNLLIGADLNGKVALDSAQGLDGTEEKLTPTRLTQLQFYQVVFAALSNMLLITSEYIRLGTAQICHPLAPVTESNFIFLH
jgi:hypothetical protein